MQTKKIKIFFVFLVILIFAGFFIFKLTNIKSGSEIYKEIRPTVGSITTFISTTGTVLPKNRLEIKPTVGGRIDQILVKEGQKVRAGQILAWMSSTERAALIDAAQKQGEAALKYWQSVYKPIALLSPIDGEVIVATTQPGQTMTTSDAVVVLSDQLIVRAQVDETDIGKIKIDQNTLVTLDAYPDTKIRAKAEHIYYESKTVNNVTIYEVDLIPAEESEFFRSGMNVSVDFIEQDKRDILLIPVDVVHRENEESFVLVRKNNDKELTKVSLTLGISDDKNIEVLSGVSEKDKIIARSKKYVLPKGSTGSNPFMPFRRR